MCVVAECNGDYNITAADNCSVIWIFWNYQLMMILNYDTNYIAMMIMMIFQNSIVA